MKWRLHEIVIMCGAFVVGAILIAFAVVLQPAIGLAAVGYGLCRLVWASYRETERIMRGINKT